MHTSHRSRKEHHQWCQTRRELFNISPEPPAGSFSPRTYHKCLRFDTSCRRTSTNLITSLPIFSIPATQAFISCKPAATGQCAQLRVAYTPAVTRREERLAPRHRTTGHPGFAPSVEGIVSGMRRRTGDRCRGLQVAMSGTLCCVIERIPWNR